MGSKRRQRRKQCEGKVKHPTRLAAETAIGKLPKVPGRDKRGMNAYRCPRCGAFHIGHANRKMLRARRRDEMGL